MEADDIRRRLQITCSDSLSLMTEHLEQTGSIAGDDTYDVDQPTMDRLVELFRETRDRA